MLNGYSSYGAKKVVWLTKQCQYCEYYTNLQPYLMSQKHFSNTQFLRIQCKAMVIMPFHLLTTLQANCISYSMYHNDIGMLHV